MLEILISSSVLILVLAILRLVLRDKISARLQYALWLLVLVRLLVPVSFFHNPVSVAEATAPLAEQAWTTSHTILYMRNAPESEFTEPSGVSTQFEESGIIIPGQALLLRDALLFIWYLGMFFMAAWFLCVNVRLARRLRRNRTPYDYHSVMPVYVAEGIPSPCLFGLFKPSIYLTERAAEDDTRARQIIAHELTHYRHGDMIWSLLRSVCLVVWWFNPLVWLAAALSRQDCELACDEGTIKALGEDARFDYGRTLVGMAKVGARPSDLLCGATTMTTGKKSLKERVARIANAPKMSVSVAIIVLLIAAIAVGCTYGSAELPEQEIAFEPAAGSASATDAEDLPAAYSVTIRDPDSGDVLTETPADDGELRELYAVYSALKTLARPMKKSDVFSDAEMSYDVRFYDDDTYIGFRMWDDGTFLLFDVKFGGNPTGVYVSPELAERFLDILDEYHGEIADADFMSDVSLGSYDREYWEEVDRELASFAYPADIEVFVSDMFTVDENVQHWSLGDLLYSTDGWQFQHNGEPIANDPFATIKVYDADGRVLWIMDDADALMIEESDGSITWVTLPEVGVDCAKWINELLPWARGELDPEAEAERGETMLIVDELGHYILPGMTEYNLSAHILSYDGGPIYNLPLWVGDRTDIAGLAVYAAYGTDTENIDLVYQRLWTDETRTELSNEKEFLAAKAYFEANTGSFYDDLTVNGYPAFAYTDPLPIVLMWYDTDAELIFCLGQYAMEPLESDASLDELIALAETVEPAA